MSADLQPEVKVCADGSFFKQWERAKDSKLTLASDVDFAFGHRRNREFDSVASVVVRGAGRTQS